MQKIHPPSKGGFLMQIIVVRYSGWQIGKVFPFGETEKGHQVVCKTLGYGKAFVMQKKSLYIYKSGNLTFTCLYNRQGFYMRES